MAKIMMLLPKKYMLDQAEKVIRENGFAVDTVRIVETVDAVNEARKCIEEGANIIVARGMQAQLIKMHTNIPVVEISMTAQEIGLLVLESKKILKKKTPRIAVVALKNLMGDISCFDQLFGVHLKCYLMDRFDEVEQAVGNAVEDGADMILGGDHVIRSVEQYHIPTLFLRSTEDSFRGALQIASKMGYAIDVEKNSRAQFATVLDIAFNGILKIDRTRTILVINHVMEELLEKPESEIVGKQLEDELTDIDVDAVESVLQGERDNYSTSIRIRRAPLLLRVAPICCDRSITGAILSCSKIKNAPQLKNKNIQDMYLSGRIAQLDFGALKILEPQLRPSIEQGKKYALSRHPVLLCGEEGTKMELLAQCIHNHSARKNFPFLMVNCSDLGDRDQYGFLFGNKASGGMEEASGVFQKCNFGTVYIDEIERLDFASQYGLYKMICYQGLVPGNMNGERHYDVRVLAGTHENLDFLMRKGYFRKDLYYSINALTLSIPPLRKRKKDIEKIVKRCLKQFMEQYSTHLTLTEEAMRAIQEYRWDGNVIQLENFCERLFLTTFKKEIDEAMVTNLLAELYPEVEISNGEKRIIVYRYPEAADIEKLLKECHGNHKAAAKELNISTTTLWRKMKKYGITGNYRRAAPDAEPEKGL